MCRSGRTSWWSIDPAEVPNADEAGLQAEGAEQQAAGTTGTIPEGESAVKPVLGRVAHGVANRTHRLKAIGNGQVPFTMAMAWNLLTEDLNIGEQADG